MRDRIITVRDLTHPAQPRPRPDLFQLRTLDQELRRRIAILDARIEALLRVPGPPTDEDVAAVDVLCAAIAEAQELRDEAHREAALHVERRRELRSRPRRWA